MSAIRHIRLGLLILGAVAPVFVGLVDGVSAQETTPDSSNIIPQGPELTVNTTLTPLPQEEAPEDGILRTVCLHPALPCVLPPVTGDLTGEGSPVGLPSGPVVIESAPSTSAPQIEAAAPPPSTLRASDVPNRAAIIWDAAFGDPLNNECDPASNPFCITVP